MSGLVTLRGSLAPVVVGHVPKELSRYVWYALEQGTKFTGRVISVKPKRSPLIQGGLEIAMVVSVQWNNARSLMILKERSEEVSYSVEKDYVDDSKSKEKILKSLLTATTMKMNSKYCKPSP